MVLGIDIVNVNMNINSDGLEKLSSDVNFNCDLEKKTKSLKCLKQKCDKQIASVHLIGCEWKKSLNKLSLSQFWSAISAAVPTIHQK